MQYAKKVNLHILTVIQENDVHVYLILKTSMLLTEMMKDHTTRKGYLNNLKFILSNVSEN